MIVFLYIVGIIAAGVFVWFLLALIANSVVSNEYKGHSYLSNCLKKLGVNAAELPSDMIDLAVELAILCSADETGRIVNNEEFCKSLDLSAYAIQAGIEGRASGREDYAAVRESLNTMIARRASRRV